MQHIILIPTVIVNVVTQASVVRTCLSAGCFAFSVFSVDLWSPWPVSFRSSINVILLLRCVSLCAHLVPPSPTSSVLVSFSVDLTVS